MLHLTNWDLLKIDEKNIYATPNDLSNYWKNKLKGDWVSPDFSLNFLDGLIKLIPDFEQFKQSLIESFNHGKYSSELLKEYIFEDVRCNSFPNLPSRKNCLFAFPEDSNIQEMRNRFDLSEKLYPNIVRIEGVEKEYNSVVVDANLLNCNMSKFDKITEFAFQYWSGEKINEPLFEILFQGKFKVTKLNN